MDVAEKAGGYWDVLRRYLYVAVDLGLLAAQAVSVEGPFQTYLVEIWQRAARLPGWAVPWRCSKTHRRSLVPTGGKCRWRSRQ